MMTKAEYLIQRFQNPTATIPFNLKWVIKTIVLCGKQCIALSGYRGDIHNSSNNCGSYYQQQTPI